MSRTVAYFFSHASPWSFMGHRRLIDLCAEVDAALDLRSISVADVFPKTGGLPLKDRPPERQSYRMAELKRWPQKLGLEIVLEPKFFPVDDKPSGRLAVAAARRGVDVGPLSERIMSGVWQREENIADLDALKRMAEDVGLDGDGLVEESLTEAASQGLADNGARALRGGCFGVPWYEVDGEPFWGQDRLDMLAERLREA
ncbi:MAG: 2-hydroxychromene-2-carboxylate isomerase [Marivibrio sp.]|uniref:2-hydroxychromene-2-carboxylate isomerase n=1 Tax=Marivibrio sp. TaxID=2039719 RepID=UPI0032EB523A